MRAVLLPSHFDADGFLRVMDPARELQRHYGLEANVAPHVVTREGKRSVANYGIYRLNGNQATLTTPLDEWLLGARFDWLWMQQRTEEWWPELIGKLQAQGKRVLVDSDDAWFDLPVWNPGSRKTDADRDNMTALLSAADHVTVATPALKEMYAYWCDATVIRNRLDWRMWDDTTPAYEGAWTKIRVGWMGNTQWRKGDLEVLRGVIGPWLETNPHVEFVAAGDPLTHDILGIPQAQRVTTNEVSYAAGDLSDITATFDIGLIPLDLSTAEARSLNECKSHLKGLEYAACGIPFIATPTESYKWLEQKACGFTARTPQEWRNSLTTLLDTSLRHAMGKTGRRVAEDTSIQKGHDEWSDIIGCGTQELALV
jgi:Glycosyl transferases group 1